MNMTQKITTASKPAPDILLNALNDAGIQPSAEVWMVGDNFLTDMKSAIAAKVTPILFGDRHLDKQRARD